MLAPPVTQSQKAKSQKQKLITAEEFAEMDELGRAELINGRIIEMPPPQNRHGRCESKFTIRIGNFVEANKLGIVMSGENGIYIQRNPDTVRAADVTFISYAQWAKQVDKDGYLEIAPELIVEILSPSDSWTKVMTKLRDYFSIGVRLVWVADTETRIVHAFRSPTDVREFKEGEELPGDEVLPGFSVAVAELFAD
ncbi:MAG: hypothetical protein Fur0022_48130 [Anaerolineales bacterium]